MLLALGAVHHRLIDEGVRGSVSLVVVSGEPRDPHDLACLVGFGASAVNPYLAIEHARDLAASGAIDVDPVAAQENYRQAMEGGLLKIMSKMGICTLSAYRGSELFEVIGLSEQVCRNGVPQRSRAAFGASGRKSSPARRCSVTRPSRPGSLIPAGSTSTAVAPTPTSPARWSCLPCRRRFDRATRKTGTSTSR